MTRDDSRDDSRKTLVIFSGGMDSTTLLYHLRDAGHQVSALGFDYGQRHKVELECARRIAETAGVGYREVDLSSLGPLIAGQSSQVNPAVAVPDGHYTEESMKATVVPNRNMIMLSIAVGHAIAIKASAVAYGAHAGDHTIYPDCRSEFVDAMRVAIELCDWSIVELLTPFVELSKADIAKRGGELRVPFDMTWSCYKGGELHCGTCGTCVERREAFELAGLADPTPYS